MSIPRNISKSDAEFTRSYGELYGIDARHNSPDGSLSQFGYLENMYVDYESGRGTVESIPGYRKITSLAGPINALHRQKISENEEYVIVHAGGSLYRFSSSERDSLGSLFPIASVNNAKSSSVCIDGVLYFFDGDKIISIDRKGEIAELSEDGECRPYVPIFYLNGEAFEERNLLTPKFRELTEGLLPSENLYSTPGLTFQVINNVDMVCRVTGCSENIDGTLYIPAYAKIGGKRYAVTEIASRAFYARGDIKGVVTSENLEIIRDNAFCNCLLLSRAVMSSTVREIEDFAFASCPYLSTLYLNRGIEKINNSAFNSSGNLRSINFGGSPDEFTSIEGYESLSAMTLNYDVTYDKLTVGLPVHTEADNLLSLTLNGNECSFVLDRAHSTLKFDLEEHELNTPLNIELIGICSDGGYVFDRGFLRSRFAERSAPERNIVCCTHSALYDGRLFIGGGDINGGTVFYCGKDADGRINPLYFPLTNYFTDGGGDYTVKGLVAAGGHLIVFKSGESDGGSVFYHKARTSDESYPAVYSHTLSSSPLAVGEFLGEALLLGKEGVFSLKGAPDSDYAKMQNYSQNVNSLLLKEDFSRFCSEKWLGYLLLSFGNSIYLADSRRVLNEGGERQYTWYRLLGIGGYANDRRVFRYSSEAREGYAIYDRVGEEAAGTVMSLIDERGEKIYFVEDGGTKYEVYPTEEYSGGDFYPVTSLLSYGNLLYFGTENGGIYLFNNDKRGVAPPSVASNPSFDAEEYARLMGNELHPYYYAFDRHAVRYTAATRNDDCGIPHLTKRTVHDSLVLRFWHTGTASVNCSVINDGAVAENYDAITSGLGLDLGSLTPRESCIRLTFPDRTRGWVEKSIMLSSFGFASPLAIHSIAYRYKIKGKIKNR